MAGRNSPLKICMFSNLFPPITSGSSTFTWELSHRLAAISHAVTVITAGFENTPSYENIEGVEVFRLPAFKLPPLRIAHNFKWMTYTFTPQNLNFLRKLFDRKRFNVLHQQGHTFDTILSSSWLAHKYRIPLVITIHTCTTSQPRL